MEINIEIDRKFAGCLKAKWLKSIIDQALSSQGLGSGAEVSLIVTGQQKIHELSKIYLGEDRPTDVLSFPMVDSSAKVGFVNAPDGKTHMGEIIVSFPQACLQAEEHGHSVEREMSILVVHGLLHLLGYDHGEAAEKREMQTREKQILGLLGKAVK